jgi:lipopolysaccharide biosynthesis protein
MFWFRPNALSTLMNFGFSMEEFSEESGQTDGTLAHAIERSFLFVVEHNGYRHKAIDLLPASRAGAQLRTESRGRSLLARYLRRTVQP